MLIQGPFEKQINEARHPGVDYINPLNMSPSLESLQAHDKPPAK